MIYDKEIQKLGQIMKALGAAVKAMNTPYIYQSFNV